MAGGASKTGGRISERTVERLCVYRRILYRIQREGQTHLYSHQLGKLARVSAEQVRRDLMAVGYSGSAQRGYEIEAILSSLAAFLDVSRVQNVALVGVGNLGRALLHYFKGRRPTLRIVAAFDDDETKTGRVVDGCRCHPIEALEKVLREKDIHLAFLAVPASVAQGVADRLVAGGVRGLVNFAAIRLSVPPGVHVEDIDITVALEKVAFYAGLGEGA